MWMDASLYYVGTAYICFSLYILCFLDMWSRFWMYKDLHVREVVRISTYLFIHCYLVLNHGKDFTIPTPYTGHVNRRVFPHKKNSKGCCKHFGSISSPGRTSSDKFNPRPGGIFPDSTRRWGGGAFPLLSAKLLDRFSIRKRNLIAPGLNFPNMLQNFIRTSLTTSQVRSRVLLLRALLSLLWPVKSRLSKVIKLKYKISNLGGVKRVLSQIFVKNANNYSRTLFELPKSHKNGK